MKRTILFCLFTFLLFSCQSEKNNNSLINDFSFDIPLANDIDDLLGSNMRTIQLDTLEEALVGRINKIIKHDNSFYISTDNSKILHFDNNGKFISSIDKKGVGPGEYSTLSDFNVCNRNGNIEIWICDFKSIRTYALSGNNWNHIENIDFGFVINKFRIISDKLLLLTGQNEETLMLTDIAGNEISSSLKKEIPYIVMKPVQFVSYDSYFIFQLGISNESVALDTRDFSFERLNITSNEQFFTSKNLLDLFDKLGQEYIAEISNTNSIRGLMKINGNIGLIYLYNGVYFVAINRNNVWKRMKFDRNNNSSIATIFASESSDSFIRHEFPEDDNQNLVLYDHIQ